MMQPIYIDKNGHQRFQANALIRWMVDRLRAKGVTLNDYPLSEMPQADIDQFYQLIGYSLSGYAELSLVSESAVGEALAAADKVTPKITTGEP